MILVTSLSMSALFVPMMAAIMYDGKKTNMSGLCSMIVGILSWLWFDFNPLSIEALGGNVDPVVVGRVRHLVGLHREGRAVQPLTAARDLRQR